MHSPSLWIPLGWGQYISHSIPSLFNPRSGSIQCFRFSLDSRSTSRIDLDKRDIRYYLAASMSRCSNQIKVPNLEMLCIRNICKYFEEPCLDDNRDVFLWKLKGVLPRKIVDIFQNTIELFDCTPLNVCPPNTTHDEDDYVSKYYCHMEIESDSSKERAADRIHHNVKTNVFARDFFHI